MVITVWLNFDKESAMYALLAICLSLCPHPELVEESVNNQLHENYAEKMLHMQCSDEAMFDELFFYACPKFITPSPPNYGKPLINFNQVWSNCKLCANPTVLSFTTVIFVQFSATRVKIFISQFSSVLVV
jgi:hypothetical protein